MKFPFLLSRVCTWLPGDEYYNVFDMGYSFIGVYILYNYVTSTTKWLCHEMLTMASVLVVYYAEKKLTYLVATILVFMNNVVLHVVVY